MLIVAVPGLAAAEALTIKAIVEPKKATIGQPLEYRVSIAGEKVSEIEVLPPVKREVYPDIAEIPNLFEKKNEEEKPEEKPGKEVPLYIIHSVKKEDNSHESLKYITVIMSVSYYRPGIYSLPEVDIFELEEDLSEDSKDKEKIKTKVGYEVPVVEIAPVSKEKEPQLQAIEPPLDLGGNYYRVAWIVIGTILLTLLGVLLYFYIKKKREERANAPVYIPPIELFIADIEKFGGEALITEGKIEEYVVGISMIFRRYLSALLSIDATEMTSHEINRVLTKVLRRDIYTRYSEEIDRCFQLWDLSKFAEFTPSEEILLDNYEKTQKMAKNLSDDIPGDINDNS
ncbi:MAG: hypothetical protein GY754_45115 [bacterium]|nr:hypothetical protein [bacterium]